MENLFWNLQKKIAGFLQWWMIILQLVVPNSVVELVLWVRRAVKHGKGLGRIWKRRKMGLPPSIFTHFYTCYCLKKGSNMTKIVVIICFRAFFLFFSTLRDSLSPESRVKRDCFKLPPNSRGLKTARLWPRISSTPNETFNFSKLSLNSVNFEVFDSINQFLIFHHFLFYNKSLNRPLKRSLWAGPRGWAGQDFN